MIKKQMCQLYSNRIIQCEDIFCLYLFHSNIHKHHCLISMRRQVSINPNRGRFQSERNPESISSFFSKKKKHLRDIKSKIKLEYKYVSLSKYHQPEPEQRHRECRFHGHIQEEKQPSLQLFTISDYSQKENLIFVKIMTMKAQMGKRKSKITEQIQWKAEIFENEEHHTHNQFAALKESLETLRHEIKYERRILNRLVIKHNRYQQRKHQSLNEMIKEDQSYFNSKIWRMNQRITSIQLNMESNHETYSSRLQNIIMPFIVRQNFIKLMEKLHIHILKDQSFLDAKNNF